MGATTAKAQRVLVDDGAKLKVDGIWGPVSQGAYNVARPETQSSVRRVFEDAGKDYPWNKVGIDVDEAKRLVALAAGEVGMTEHIPALQKFLDLEAPRLATNRGQYDVRATNGSSRGLMQMQPAAWEDAQKTHPSLRDYSKVYDPYQNILAGVAYAKRNARGLVRRGYPVTDKNLYLAHNQGIGYFDGIRTAVDRQSTRVQALIKSGADV